MRALLDRIELWWYARQAGRSQPIWPVVLMLLGFVLFTFGAVRTGMSLRAREVLRNEVARLSDEIVDLEAAASMQIGGGNLATKEGYFEGAIPYGRVPGPILQELLSKLKDAGVTDYEYRIREPLKTLDPQARANDEYGDEFADDYGNEDDDQLWDEDDWESDSSGESQSAVAAATSDVIEVTPGLTLLQWTVEVSVRSSYAKILQFVSGLAKAERHWRVSHLEISRMSPYLEASLVLKTFTRADGKEEAVETLGPVAFHNPFVVERREQGTGRALPPTPKLRAVLAGSQPRAWLGDHIVTTGETVASWTVEEIDEEGIWIRHAGGRRIRLAVAG